VVGCEFVKQSAEALYSTRSEDLGVWHGTPGYFLAGTVGAVESAKHVS
jgi:hypothetical protein